RESARAPPARPAGALSSRGRAGPAAGRSSRGGSCLPRQGVVGDLVELLGLPAGLGEGGARLAMGLRRELPCPLQPVNAHIGDLPVSLVGPLRLSQRGLVTGHVEYVVDDLEEHAKL